MCNAVIALVHCRDDDCDPLARLPRQTRALEDDRLVQFEMREQRARVERLHAVNVRDAAPRRHDGVIGGAQVPISVIEMDRRDPWHRYPPARALPGADEWTRETLRRARTYRNLTSRQRVSTRVRL